MDEFDEEADEPQLGEWVSISEVDVRDEESYEKGADDEREAVIAVLGAAGCVCFDLDPAECRAVFRSNGKGDPGGCVEAHDPRCPIALAAAIEARGKEGR